MGFFDKTEVETVWTTTSPLMSPPFPDAIREAILYAILENGNIADHIIDASVNSFSNSIERAWNYAKKGDETNGNEGYFLGLPEGTQYVGKIKRDEFISLLETAYGRKVTITSINITPFNVLTYGMMYIQFNYNWNFSQKGIIYTTRPNDLYKITSIKSNYSGTKITFKTKAKLYDIDLSVAYYEYFDFTINAPTTPGPWYNVVYHFSDEPSYYSRYIAYDVSTNNLPTLTPDKGIYKKEYYPIIPLRIANKNMDDWAEQLGGDTKKIYDTGKKLLGLLSADIDSLIDNVSSPEDPDDLEDISDVYFVFGINIYTEEQISIEYLYEHFKLLHDRGGVNKAEWYESIGVDPATGRPITGKYSRGVVNTIITEDSYYGTGIQYNFITVTNKTGSIGKVGEYSKLIYVQDWFVATNGSVIIGDGDMNPDFERFEYNISNIFFNKQISSNSYIEIRVSGLLHYSNVKITNDRILSELSYKKKDRKSGSFFIPINHTVIKEMSSRDRTYVMYDAMRVVIYSIHIEKLSWYESDSFLRLVEVVGYFMMFISLGTSTAISTAITQAAVRAAVVRHALKMVIMAIVVKHGVRWLLENVGGKLGMALAMAFSVAMGYKTGTLTLGVADIFKTIAKVVALVANVVNTSIELEMEGLKDDYEDWLELYETRMDAFEDASSILDDTYNLMNPLMLIKEKMTLDLSQSPAEFYQIKLETNPGIQTLEYPKYAVDFLLTLPELDIEGELT